MSRGGLYVKLPIVVEVRQWWPDDEAHTEEVIAWLEAGEAHFALRNYGIKQLKLHTLEGLMTVEPGAWIIKGPFGEFYPNRGDIFGSTYRPATEAETAAYHEGVFRPVELMPDGN